MHPLKSFDKWLRQQPEEYSKEIAISIARMLMPNSQLNGNPIDALLQWCAEVQEYLSIVGRSMSIRSAFDYLFLPYINDGVWEALEYQSESFRAHAVDDANLTMIGFFDRNIGGIHARRAQWREIVISWQRFCIDSFNDARLHEWEREQRIPRKTSEIPEFGAEP